jgi:hypothetical protein
VGLVRPYVVRSECGSCGTTHQHKTHKTELREVHYPWHPLYRQSIPVRLEGRWKNGLVARCDPHNDVGRRGFDIPVWMLDCAVCSTMTLSQTALVDAEALRQLRQLLDLALGTDDSDVVQGGHRLDAVQGGAHAQTVSQTRAAGVVSPPSKIPDWKALPETIREKVLWSFRHQLWVGFV